MLHIIGWIMLLPAAVCTASGYFMAFGRAASVLELHKLENKKKDRRKVKNHAFYNIQ